ncbi:hypothetical protein ACEQUB_p01118 (plasmid) [Ralstonia syzygii]
MGSAPSARPPGLALQPYLSQSHFTRVTTRVALESALVYHPATGEVETVVKGGAKNRTAMLELFGKHVVQQDLAPERIEPQRYHLNALRDGLQPYEDWSAYGVEMVRLRRARLTPVGIAGVSFTVEASPDKAQGDAIRIARAALKVEHMFEAEYHLDAATVIVYTQVAEFGLHPFLANHPSHPPPQLPHQPGSDWHQTGLFASGPHRFDLYNDFDESE